MGSMIGEVECGWLVTPDRGQPGLDLRRAVHRVDLEGVGGNRLDSPAVAERRAQLVRADAARAPGPWLPVAEAHEVASAGWPQRSREAGDAVSYTHLRAHETRHDLV